MTKRIVLISCFALLFLYGVVAQRGRVEAVEIGRQNTDLLPKGKEADGIIGDFVLRNDRVEALISGSYAAAARQHEHRVWLCHAGLPLRPGPARRGQRSAHGVSARRLRRRDFIRARRRGWLNGRRRHRGRAHGGQGRRPLHAARISSGAGLAARPGDLHLPQRKPGSEGDHAAAGLEGPVEEKQAGWIRVGDSVDAFDKRAYAWGAGRRPTDLPEKVRCSPERRKGVSRRIRSGRLPAGRVSECWRRSAARTGEVSGAVRDTAGSAPVHASLLVPVEGQSLAQYPDAAGKFSFRLPAGDYPVRFEDIGRDPARAAGLGAGQPDGFAGSRGPAGLGGAGGDSRRERPILARQGAVHRDGAVRPTPTSAPSIASTATRTNTRPTTAVSRSRFRPASIWCGSRTGRSSICSRQTIDVAKGQTGRRQSHAQAHGRYNGLGRAPTTTLTRRPAATTTAIPTTG